jgi:hypothetical protein
MFTIIKISNINIGSGNLTGYKKGDIVNVICDALNEEIQLKMDDSKLLTQNMFLILKSDTSLNRVYIRPFPGQTINGNTDYITLGSKGEGVTVFSDGLNLWAV